MPTYQNPAMAASPFPSWIDPNDPNSNRQRQLSNAYGQGPPPPPPFYPPGSMPTPPAPQVAQASGVELRQPPNPATPPPAPPPPLPIPPQYQFGWQQAQPGQQPPPMPPPGRDPVPFTASPPATGYNDSVMAAVERSMRDAAAAQPQAGGIDNLMPPRQPTSIQYPNGQTFPFPAAPPSSSVGGMPAPTVPMAGGVPINTPGELYPAASVSAVQQYLSGSGGGGIPSGVSFDPGSMLAIAPGQPIPSWAREATGSNGERYMEVLRDPSAPSPGAVGGPAGGGQGGLSMPSLEQFARSHPAQRRYGIASAANDPQVLQDYLRMTTMQQDAANRSFETQRRYGPGGLESDRNDILRTQANNEAARLAAMDPNNPATLRRNFITALRVQNPNMSEAELNLRADRAGYTAAPAPAPGGVAPAAGPAPPAAAQPVQPRDPNRPPPVTEAAQPASPPATTPNVQENLAAAINLIPGLGQPSAPASGGERPADITPAQFVARLQNSEQGRALFADTPAGRANRDVFVNYLNSRFTPGAVRSHGVGYRTSNLFGLPVATTTPRANLGMGAGIGLGGTAGAAGLLGGLAPALAYPLLLAQGAMSLPAASDYIRTGIQGGPTEDMEGGEMLRNILAGRW